MKTKARAKDYPNTLLKYVFTFHLLVRVLLANYSHTNQDDFHGGAGCFEQYLEGDICHGERIETKSLAQENGLQLIISTDGEIF